MYDPVHYENLNKGVGFWNEWRAKNKKIKPNLRKADLSGERFCGANLSETNLRRAILRETDLSGANIRRANVSRADLEGADLSEANIRGANLEKANLTGACLSYADLSRADLTDANLSGADLTGVNLTRATLVKTVLDHADLSGASIYGISAWSVSKEGLIQEDLAITPSGESTITVDDLEVAQFTFLLLNNERIRNVIDTIGAKAVLILGRFTKERKDVLDAIRDQLRQLGFVPMMFDFEKPTQRDFTETIKTLAGLSRFIIADITNPKSSPLELQAIMPDYMIPFVPIIQEDEKPFAMFQDLQQKYGEWVLDILKYDSPENLIKVLDKAVVKPALQKGEELLIKKAESIRDRHVKDYM